MAIERKKKELSDMYRTAHALEAIGIIVIWEGNYNPDILNIGTDPPNHEQNLQGNFKYGKRCQAPF